MKNLFIPLVVLSLLILSGCSKENENGPVLSDTDIMEGSTEFTGMYPAPVKVSFNNDGQTQKVRCFNGQAIVFIQQAVPDSTATAIIQLSGATIMEKVPMAGYYLVTPTSGTLQEMINALRVNEEVEMVLPNIAGFLRSGAAILDHCGFDHGRKVLETLQSCGGTFDECVKVTADGNLGSDNGEPTALSKVIRGILEEANENEGGPTLINISSNGGLENNTNFDSIPEALQQEGLNGWYSFMQGVLMTIAALPEEFRANLVVTIAAGNENMPVDGLLSQLRQRDRLAEILHNNVVIVSTALVEPGANYAPDDPDVVVMNNDSSMYGTSLAAPCAMGVIQTVMQEKGVGAKEALQLVKQASLNNPNREVTWSALLEMKSYSCEKTTVTFGPYVSHSGPNTCTSFLYFDLQPTLYWNGSKGTLVIPTHYFRTVEGDGCVMSGITEYDNTLNILLSGTNSYIHGVGTAHFLSGGENEQGICIGFDLPSVFWGELQGNNQVSGNLKLTITVLSYTGDSQTIPITLNLQ